MKQYFLKRLFNLIFFISLNNLFISLYSSCNVFMTSGQYYSFPVFVNSRYSIRNMPYVQHGYQKYVKITCTKIGKPVDGVIPYRCTLFIKPNAPLNVVIAIYQKNALKEVSEICSVGIASKKDFSLEHHFFKLDRANNILDEPIFLNLLPGQVIDLKELSYQSDRLSSSYATDYALVWPGWIYDKTKICPFLSCSKEYNGTKIVKKYTLTIPQACANLSFVVVAKTNMTMQGKVYNVVVKNKNI